MLIYSHQQKCEIANTTLLDVHERIFLGFFCVFLDALNLCCAYWATLNHSLVQLPWVWVPSNMISVPVVHRFQQPGGQWWLLQMQHWWLSYFWIFSIPQLLSPQHPAPLSSRKRLCQLLYILKIYCVHFFGAKKQ